MLRKSDWLLISVVAAVAALGLAGAQAQNGKTTEPAAEQPVAAAAVATTPEAAKKAEAGQAVAAAIAASPACARKVKVIYSGYGESERAGCAR